MPSQSGSSKSAGRGVFIFLAAIGLVFAAIGLLALSAALRAHTMKDAMGPIIAGGIFTLVGLLVTFGSIRGAASEGRKNALIEAHPGKPWMWREEWANSTIKDSNKGSAIGLWIFSVLWNSIAFPIAFLATKQMTGEVWPLLVVYIFPFVGLLLLISAIYSTARSMKFGTSVCRIERVPIVPGRVFRGSIEIGKDVAPASGFQVRLASIRITTTRSGKNRSTTEHLLWDTATTVDASSAMRSPMGTRVPFQLAVPPDARVTDESDYYDRSIWRLSVQAEVAGVDYSAQFEVPVFETGEAVDAREFASFEQRHRAAAARIDIKANSGVQITRLATGGEEFRMHAAKTIGGTISSILFLAAWNAAIVAFIRFGAPWGFPAFFIALDILFLLATIDYFLGRSTITVDKSGVRVRKEWLGAGSTKFFEEASIVSIDGVAPAQNSKSYGVMLKLRDGVRPRQLGAALTDREIAEAVAAKMMNDLGRNASAS